MRVVLDTNVIVSALLFKRGSLTRLRDLWTAGRILPLTDRPCAEELLRVLAYPEFALEAPDITALLEQYLPFTESVRARRVRVPRCRDADDEKFLRLAMAGAAEALVTGDETLLELAPRVRFAIEPPAAFLVRFG